MLHLNVYAHNKRTEISLFSPLSPSLFLPSCYLRFKEIKQSPELAAKYIQIFDLMENINPCMNVVNHL